MKFTDPVGAQLNLSEMLQILGNGYSRGQRRVASWCLRISGHLCVYIQAVAAIAHQNLVLLRKKNCFNICILKVSESHWFMRIQILIMEERSLRQRSKNHFYFNWGKALCIVENIVTFFCLWQKNTLCCQTVQNIPPFSLVEEKKL